MAAMSGIHRVVEMMRIRALEAGVSMGRVVHSYPTNVGKVLREAADTADGLEEAARKRLSSIFDNKVQARLTSGEGDRRSHWLLYAGDNVYASTVHNKNYNLAQSRALMWHLDEWIRATAGKKRIIIVEGRVPDVPAGFRKVYDSLLERVFASERGEVAAIVLKGKVERVKVVSGEEGEGLQFAALLQNHRPEHVLGYYVLRQMPQALAARKKALDAGEPALDMDTYLSETLDRFAPHMPKGMDARHTFNDLMAREYAHTGFDGQFREGDEHWLMRETNDPAIKGAETPVQEVSLECNQRRDKHFAELYQNLVDEGYAVFGQFGDIHKLDVPPKIRALDDSTAVELPGGSPPADRPTGA
ncbi:hypothetical protein [Nocardia sp. NPDC019395]|uniref:hypothetical protein n=1 Tax=Nocardia sp. NPDC019395 TaxID=3154686 RepID=UPI0034031665